MKQRELSKEDKSLTWEEIMPILEKGQEGVLGLHGLDGYPYAVPMNYVFWDNKIISHSPPKGYKIECLKQNPKVTFTVYNVFEVKATTSNWESAMVFGTAEIIEDAEDKDKFMRKLAGKFQGKEVGPLPGDLLKRIALLVIDIEEYSGKLKKE